MYKHVYLTALFNDFDAMLISSLYLNRYYSMFFSQRGVTTSSPLMLCYCKSFIKNPLNVLYVKIP